MIKRYVKIKNYRNIGGGEYQKLELNAITSKSDKMGGLVTLIGENNVGKSNYLDALTTLKDQNIEPSDAPYHSYDTDIKTDIVLWLREENDNVTEYKYKVSNDNVFIEKYHNDKVVKNKTASHNKDISLAFREKERQYLIRLRSEWLILMNKTPRIRITLNKNEKNSDSINEYTQAHLQDIIRRVRDNEAKYKDFKILLNLLENTEFLTRVKNRYNERDKQHIIDLKHYIESNLNVDDIENEVTSNYNLKLRPNVIKYDDTNGFKDKDMISEVNKGKLTNNEFFKTLFNVLSNKNYEELENAYKKFHDMPNNRAFISNFEKQVNNDLEKLSKEFNYVYGHKDNKRYLFSVKLETNKIYFQISEDNFDVPFDSQSAGFKWFFNFFFSVFANNDLNNGDIIIMDEPATNLHVSGQKELRRQIKEFGVENGITFILSTHSPFLIDLDYLDELRIVYKKEMHSYIENKFSVSDEQLVNVLMPIQSSLTIDPHILNNPNKTLIFVEGITDYNYLVAFKNMLDYQQFTFLPIQGIKKTHKVFKQLSISFNNPILLVDSDEAGKKAFEQSQKDKHKDIEVRQLNEVNDRYVTIEDLFSEAEKKKYFPEKSYVHSTYFKNYLDLTGLKVSKKTQENFKNLFDQLSV